MSDFLNIESLRLGLISLVCLFLVACGQEKVETPSEPVTEVEAPVQTETPTDVVKNEDDDQVCGGIAGLPCGDGEYCQMAEGTCNIADNMGVCRPKAEMCTMDYHPVCGCDGKSYGNACAAAGAAISIDHQGECKVAE